MGNSRILKAESNVSASALIYKYKYDTKKVFTDDDIL